MSSYAYHPLEDSFFGKLIGEVLHSNGISREEILNSIHSNLEFPEKKFSFTGTPKADKQIQMSILPVKIRKWISEKKYKEIQDEFRGLAFGKNQEKPKIDLALEILEWIVSGFEEDELVLELIKILTGHKIPVELNLVESLKSEYETAIQG
ncbi:MAG: hypothetical protein L6Q54_06865 [Leptospiraceae bacterium]|nr:hypothetical protein [Leptospiraceae bacterium]MCK6380959.1 hypothetical protein [Leptospiraceae bacterium]NUM40946.1 hypothetical protein [Leptospiraceae bacterium]